MFKVEAAKQKTGNWLIEATCTNGHTCFKDQMHANDKYRCPYCGHDVH